LSARFECFCFLITALNGVKFGFTSLDRTLEINNVFYEPLGGVESTATNQSAGLSVDNIRLELLLDRTILLTPRYIAGGALANAEATVAIVDFTALPATLEAAHVIFNGYVSETSLTNTTINIELLARTTNLNKNIEENLGATCRFELGDNRCQANLVGQGYQVVRSVASVTILPDGYNIVMAAHTFATSYWVGGSAKFVTGLNAGMQYRIAQASGSTFKIESETPEVINVGDTIELKAGCSKDRAACAFYNNSLRYGGGLIGGNHFRSLADLD
jgi:uncharacterized phage protein (TIGR02218 family)